jgi:hypothetical protein
MNLTELDTALRKLRLSAMAATLEVRLLQAQTEEMAPIDLVSVLVSDELTRRAERLVERRVKQAAFRDPNKALDGTRKERMEELGAISLLIIDDLGMRKLPHTAAEDLLELIMRRYERTSTLITSNRPVEDWGKLLGDTAAVSLIFYSWREGSHCESQ